MIKIENAQLNAIIKCLDFNNQMRVNSKYIEILSHVGEENKEKAERLISAYIFHCLMNNDFLIETLISSESFLNKISIMTNEQVETYIKLCLNAKLGILIISKTLLKEYNVEDHLRICELHIAYFENPVLAEIIEVAAKH
ncbi:MAG: hypothetical protein K2G03_02975, partial [Bacilli bacterium]|nr:hypothetical protein [Bacilli bacterium]